MSAKSGISLWEHEAILSIIVVRFIYEREEK